MSPTNAKNGVEIDSLLGLLKVKGSSKWRCPICNAENEYQKSDGDMIYCPVCNGYYYLSELDDDVQKQQQFIGEFKEQYELLQAAEFETVSQWAVQRLNDPAYKEYEDFLRYLKFRADFNILGPIVTPQGLNTHVFTPCAIEKFDPKKMEASEDFVFRGEGPLSAAEREAILRSAKEYTAHWSKIKTRRLEDFDIFICHKTDDPAEGGNGTENTRDFKIGLQMYKLLKSEGYKVFFAPRTKEEEGILVNEYESNWRQWIYDALITSELMIVIGTKRDYFLSPNVRNEWATFKAFMHNQYYGVAKHFMIVTEGFDVEELGQGYEKDLESCFQRFIGGKAKLNKKAFLKEIRSMDYRFNPATGYLNHPKKSFTYLDEEQELTKMRNSLLDRDTKEEIFEGYAKGIWSRFRSEEAALELGLLEMRRANNYLETYERKERDRHYAEAFRWFSSASSDRAKAYRAFCLYNGYGCEENKKAAMRLLRETADDVGRYFYSVFTLRKYIEEGKNEDDEFTADENSVGVSEADLGRAMHYVKSLRETLPEANAVYSKCIDYGLVTEGADDDSIGGRS